MIIPSLLLLVATALGASEPPQVHDPTMPPLVLPNLECLDKNGKPLPEATFAPVDDLLPMTAPKGTHRPIPPPPPTRKCKAPAVVELEFVITTKGTVCGATVVSDLAPECQHYGTAALKTVKNWKFEPARAGNEAVPTRYHLRLNWN